jgi:hypothetical protein
MRERSVVHSWVGGAASGRQVPGIRSFWEDELGPRLVAFGCAAVLLLAIVAPRELARTSWEQGHTMINDDPSGYVGLMSLCGLAALVALAAEAWSRRWAVAAALVAAAAFAFGTWVAGTYWLGFPRGDRLREGQDMLGRKVEVHFPLLLPVFALAAGAGLVCALVLVIHGWRRVHNGEKGFSAPIAGSCR